MTPEVAAQGPSPMCWGGHWWGSHANPRLNPKGPPSGSTKGQQGQPPPPGAASGSWWRGLLTTSAPRTRLPIFSASFPILSCQRGLPVGHGKPQISVGLSSPRILLEPLKVPPSSPPAKHGLDRRGAFTHWGVDEDGWPGEGRTE